MREIKFRAWIKNANYANEYGMGIIKNAEFTGTNQPFDFVELHGFTGSFRLDDIEVMQFTGLLDRHGKEIYEGDILKWLCTKSGDKKEKNYIVVIDWERHMYRITIHHNGEKWATGKSYWNNDDREVIGNIYENPDKLHVATSDALK